MNQLHVVALNEGLRRKKALWRPAGRNELGSLKLAPWASRRRQDLLDLLDQLTPKIQDLTRHLEQEVGRRPVTRRLMTHPGVGRLTALAYELVIGTRQFSACKRIFLHRTRESDPKAHAVSGSKLSGACLLKADAWPGRLNHLSA